MAKNTRYYLTDLAYIHHQGYSQFGRGAARWIVRLLKASGIDSGKIVELGCGSGAVTSVLLQQGYKVSAVDGSPAMIALAKKSCPRGRFTVGSLWDYDIKRCTAVVSVGECLNYHFETVRLRRLFTRIHDALLPGGILSFDLLLASRMKRPSGSQGFSQGKDWFVAVNRLETSNKIIREITYFRKQGGRYRRGVETHVQQKYDRAEISSLLVHSGFSVEVFPGYGRKPLGRGHMVFVARKRRESA